MTSHSWVLPNLFATGDGNACRPHERSNGAPERGSHRLSLSGVARQAERRAAMGLMLANIITRDPLLRKEILPEAAMKLLTLLKSDGPGSTEAYHYVSAAMQIYVLDEGAMELISNDRGPDNKGDNGTVRMFKQCLETLVDLVGRLESRDMGSMAPQQIITVRRAAAPLPRLPSLGSPPLTLLLRLQERGMNASRVGDEGVDSARGASHSVAIHRGGAARLATLRERGTNAPRRTRRR